VPKESFAGPGDRPPALTVVIPVFNEEDNIVPLAREVLHALEPTGVSFEILFVDDASRDGTPNALRQAGALDARVRWVRHAANAGQSAALWTGLRASSSLWVATLDGDGQNDPADLPVMMKRLEPVDMVCGHRVTRQDSWLRRCSSRIAFGARAWILGSSFRDTGCALRVFRRSCVESLFPFNGIHRFLPILVARSGGRVEEVPVGHRPRAFGVSKYGVWNRLWRGLFDLAGVAWYLKRRLPEQPLDPG